MDEKDSKRPRGRRVFGPPGVVPEGHVVTDGGWVVPRPATVDDVRRAVQERAAEVRQQIEELRAQSAARPAPAESSPTRVVVGAGAIGPAMVDVKSCAALLGISVRSWQRLVERGEAPKPVKIGKSSRWRRSDVEAYIASRR
jgi:predicted DNA-binding transcriptional regulator AlpA